MILCMIISLKLSETDKIKNLILTEVYKEGLHAFDEIDFDADIDDYRDRIQTLEDLVRFPLTSDYKSCFRAESIYCDKVKEILGIDIR